MTSKIKFSDYFLQQNKESEKFYNICIKFLDSEEKFLVQKMIFSYDNLHFKLSYFRNPETRFEELKEAYEKRNKKIVEFTDKILMSRIEKLENGI